MTSLPNEYLVNIQVNKSINLIGENRYTTIIDGLENALYGIYIEEFIDQNEIYIAGFTIKNTAAGIYIFNNSANIIIEKCIIKNNTDGLKIQDTSNVSFWELNIKNNNLNGFNLININNFTINECNIINNGLVGIDLTPKSGNLCKNNLIYNCNFLNNPKNVNDSNNEQSNLWYNNSINQGNYYDDYNGSDNNFDGIGDSPYQIPGGNSIDNYPLMSLFGPPYADFDYSVIGRNIILNASLSYDYDGIIQSYNWDYGDGQSSTDILVEHTYDTYDIYNVTLEVTDDSGLINNITKAVSIVDLLSPDIENFKIFPRLQIPGGNINISSEIFDYAGLAEINLSLKYPDNSIENISIIENKNGNIYFYNSSYNMIGEYKCWKKAIDLNGNSNITLPKVFFIAEEFLIDAGGPYFGSLGTPVEFHGYAINGIPPYNWHWDFGDGTVSYVRDPVHNYTETGNYSIVLTVKDSANNTFTDITWAVIEEALNSPPYPPLINGPAYGRSGKMYSYAIVTSDKNNDDVYYEIYWGDGTFNGWLGPFYSGDAISVSHNWTDNGFYTILIRSKAVYDAISDWSEHKVIIPRNRNFYNLIWSRIFDFIPNLQRVIHLIF
jgi:PKD repeat protein